MLGARVVLTEAIWLTSKNGLVKTKSVQQVVDICVNIGNKQKYHVHMYILRFISHKQLYIL